MEALDNTIFFRFSTVCVALTVVLLHLRRVPRFRLKSDLAVSRLRHVRRGFVPVECQLCRLLGEISRTDGSDLGCVGHDGKGGQGRPAEKARQLDGSRGRACARVHRDRRYLRSGGFLRSEPGDLSLLIGIAGNLIKFDLAVWRLARPALSRQGFGRVPPMALWLVLPRLPPVSCGGTRTYRNGIHRGRKCPTFRTTLPRWIYSRHPRDRGARKYPLG